MKNELREKAEKKVNAKTTFYILTFVFAGVAVILLMLSFYLTGISFWLRLPIPILIMVLGIVYVSLFGLSGDWTLSDEWKEQEIEEEMMRLLQKKRQQLLDTGGELSEEESLDLRELETLKQKRDEDYV